MSVEGVDEDGRSETEAAASHADDVTHTNPEEELSSCLMEDDFTNSASDLASLGNPTLHDLFLCVCVHGNATHPCLCVVINLCASTFAFNLFIIMIPRFSRAA